MNKKLRVLILEDRPADAEVMLREVRRAGYEPEWKRVETEPDYLAQLEQGWEIILADYTLPQFTGLRALELLNERGWDIPFIIVSGTVGEDKAVAAMRAGASDYVMKDRLARLGPAVERELRDAAERRERRQAEAALRQSEGRYRTLVEAATDAIITMGADLRVHFYNPAAARIFGFAAEEMLGREVDVLIPPEYGDRHRRGVQRYLETGQPVIMGQVVELKGQRRDGSVFPLELAISESRVGTECAFTAVIRDITERKRAEKALRDSLRRFELLTAVAGDLLVMADPHEFVKALCARVMEHLDCHAFFNFLADEESGRLHLNAYAGVSDEEARSIEWLDYGVGVCGRAARDGCRIVAEHIQDTPEPSTELVKSYGIRAYACHTLMAEGKVIGTLSFGTRIRDKFSDDDLSAMKAVTDQVTGALIRAKALDALRASERKYKHFFEQDLAGHYVSAPDGSLLACNSAFARMLGFTSTEEAMGANMVSCYATPAAREAFQEFLRTKGRVEHLETELRRKDGAPVQLIESAVAVLDADGRELREIHGFLIDDTERRKAEAQFRQAQKMEAVGSLAGGVAHDFNNILGVILGYGELAQRQLGPGHPVRARVDQMVNAAERAASLTRQLLAFSRKQVMQPKLLDLNSIVAETQEMLGRLIGEDVQLVIHTARDLGTVNADPGQVEQIILNLAVNACDAMPKGGSLTLETADVDIDEEYCAAHTAAAPGRYVMLAVSDTGIGMDAETQRRIFEPFFTTKPTGEGTGLGLATVYGIVKQSGGYIWVYSEPGRGTTFKVYLPRVDESEEVARPTGPPAEAPRGQETILLVEDSEALQQVIRETLAESGYTVLLALNGEEALALARGREGSIDLLLTDVVMPKLGGGELAKRLSVLRPEMRVLYMSGYTDGAISQHGVLGPEVVLLEKPFTADKLARAVRDALDRPTAT